MEAPDLEMFTLDMTFERPLGFAWVLIGVAMPDTTGSFLRDDKT
jgi:hypothetical protein